MRWPPRRVLFCLVLVFLGLLAANLQLFLTRGWEDSIYPWDYASLYYPLDAPGVREWVVEPDNVLQLDLVWNKTPEAWQVIIDGKAVQTIPAGSPLRFKVPAPLYDGLSKAPLSDFKHRCTLRPLPAGIGPDLDFTIYGLSTDLYRRGGMHWRSDVAYLVYTDLPVGKFKRYPVSYWTDDYHYLDAASLAAADRVVREDMGVTSSDDSFTRIEKVARYLRTKLVNAAGIPKDDFRWMDPWHMWLDMINGTGKGWCTQHAQIYTFFANRAGVPTRFVFGANTEKALIVYTGHSWAESWIREQNRWAFVDEDQAIMWVKDRDGALLNTADILHLCAHDTFDGITAHVYAAENKLSACTTDWNWRDFKVEAGPGGYANVPFAMVSGLYKQEFSRQAIVKYRRPPDVEDLREVNSMLLKSWTFAWVNIDRYLFQPTPVYSNLPTDGPHNYQVRQALFVGMVASLLLIVGVLFWRRRP